nr:glycosyltransferase [Campylobacter sp.]
MSKILLVVQTLSKGGAERVVSNLSKEFERIGHEVKIVLFNDIVCYEYGGEIVNLNLPASKNYLIKFFRLFQRITRLKKIFNQENPDFIFSFMESANFPCILTGKKVFVSVRCNPNLFFSIFQKILVKFLYNFNNVMVIPCSKGIELILNNEYGVKNTKTMLNPVIFDNCCEIKEDLSRYKPFILAVGRLDWSKNFEMLIRAFSKTRTSHEAKLIILGDGQKQEELRALISKLNLNEKVLLLGNRDNIRDYYLQSKIFVLSSKTEGFPNVLIEALSNNCACIATDCPTGPNEIIQNNFNGILVENKNEETMTKAIDELYFNEELIVKFKSNAAKSIEYLSVENIAKKWLTL